MACRSSSASAFPARGWWPTRAATPPPCALSVAPLLKAGLLDEGSLIFDAASGTTGAGRKGSEDMSFSEVDEDFRAYRVLRHQHTPEIAQTLAGVAGRTVPLTFTAHLLPLKRGILVTAYARLRPGATAAEARAALEQAYASEPLPDGGGLAGRGEPQGRGGHQPLHGRPSPPTPPATTRAAWW